MVKLARILRTEFRDDEFPSKPSPRGRRGTYSNNKGSSTTTPPAPRADAPAGTGGVVAAAVGAIERSISPPTTKTPSSGLLGILQNNMGGTATTTAFAPEDEQRNPVETFSPIVIDPIQDPHLYALTRAAQLAAQKAAQSSSNRDPPPFPKAVVAAKKQEAPASQTNDKVTSPVVVQSPIMPKEETTIREEREQSMVTMAMLSGEVEDAAFSDALQSMLGEDNEGDGETGGLDKETESKLNETLQKCGPNLKGASLDKPSTGLTVNTCLSADDAVAVTTTTPARHSDTPIMADTGGFGRINKAQSSASHQHQHSSPSRRNLFKQRRGGRKERAERRKAEKAAKKMAQEASKNMIQEAMKMATKATAAGNDDIAPQNVINLVYNNMKKNSGATAEAEMRRKQAAQADIELARNAVAQKLQQQRKEQQQQKEEEKRAAGEKEAETTPLQHKNKYKHIGQIEPQVRIVQVATSRSDEEGFEEELSFRDTISGSLSGSFSFSGDDGDSDESDSEDDSDSDDEDEESCVLDTPKNADTLFELESKLSGSTCSSSSISSSSSMMSDDSLGSSDEEDSLAHDDEEDSLVNTIVGADANDDDTLVDTIVDGDDTVCNANDTIIGDGETDDDLFLTDGGETDLETSADEDSFSEEEGEEVAFFASFCQRPEDSSFDLIDEGNYNPRKEGKHKTRRYRAKKDSILDVTEVPALLKCVSGYFVGEVHTEKSKTRKTSSSRRHRLKPRHSGHV